MRKFITACLAGCVVMAASFVASPAHSDPAGNPAIIGGTTAAAGAWPFQVALLRANQGSNYDSMHCGGTLVDKFHVVTAGHCVVGLKPSQLLVLVGTRSLSSGGTRHKVASIKRHPNYDDGGAPDYDIAVIMLKTPATGITVFASLLTKSQESTLANTGTEAYVIGWGSTIKSGGGYPSLLRQAAVPIVSRSNCNDSNSYDGEITARMMCAGYDAGGKDSCDGDSGGPLIAKNAQGVWRLQVGIVSWGDGCARRNLFGVYARLAVLSAWAKGVIAANASLVAKLDCERLSGQGRRLCLANRAR